ncbi:MAG: hypothetical protein PHC61_19010, partial [Chitinivibrionales bacterium]|nr:hypothetical protein [Chitinivibrionales bacterium]
MRILFVNSTFVVLCAACLCCGRGLYIDFANGNDANAGNAPPAAWQHCPGDVAAAGRARGAALQPGDTLFFKAGVIYKGQIAL